MISFQASHFFKPYHVATGCKCRKTIAFNIQEALKFIGIESQSAGKKLKEWLKKNKKMAVRINKCVSRWERRGHQQRDVAI